MEDAFDALVKKVMAEDDVPYSQAFRQATVESGTDPLDKKTWQIVRADGITYGEALRRAVQDDPSLRQYM